MSRDEERQIPPAPWTLHGTACFSMQLVRKEQVRALLPQDARVICLWPGRTLAIVYLAQYRESPVGAYHEIIVAPALIRLQGKVGFWISHILVDSELSVLAGRSIWALPKECVPMQWHSAGMRITASQLSLEAAFTPPRRSLRLPFIGTALSKRGPVANSFIVRGSARVGVTRGSIGLTGDAPLEQLGFTGRRRMYVCADLNIRIEPPRP